MIDEPTPSIPAGMKAWHGGDNAPSDWDGGSVLLRCGLTTTQSTTLYWAHESRAGEYADDVRDGDIIAYTPTPSPDHASALETNNWVQGSSCQAYGVERIKRGYADAVAGLRYIEQHHGRLYGVGWDRVFDEFEAIRALAMGVGDAK